MSRTRIVMKTLAQTVVFWGTFLFLLPAAIIWLENTLAWDAFRFTSDITRWAGIVVFALAGSLGLTSGATMSVVGRGTPVPFDCAPRLVIAGPYRYVRNPMVVAGILQGVGVGLFLGSWPVIIYAICGAIVWNTIIRPWEERDLLARFGEPYERYRSNVRCWIPQFTRQSAMQDAGDESPTLRR